MNLQVLIDQLKDQVSALERENEELRQGLASRDETISWLEKELTALKAQSTEPVAWIHPMDQEEIASLREQMAEANKRIRMLETANRTYATIERELAEAKKDAERYRWLRENPTWIGYDSDYRADEVDAVIDQAMGEKE